MHLLHVSSAEGKVQQQMLRDELGQDLLHQSSVIWKLPSAKKLFVAISPQSLQGADMSSCICTPQLWMTKGGEDKPLGSVHWI